MIEKGVSHPPRFESRQIEGVMERLGLGYLLRHLEQLDIWFRPVRDRYPKMQTYAVALNVAAVSANAVEEQTFTVSGLNTLDIVTVNKPSLSAGLGIVNARVSAADTLAITFANVTGAPINPAEETYLISTIRR